MGALKKNQEDDWTDAGAPDAQRALESERLTSARLRRELEQVRRLSSDLIVREQAARAAAEAANRSKDEFLATLSHEIRTPLNVVLGLVWRLRNRPMDAEAVRRALEVIDRNTRLQAQLVEDLLDVSRIITGKLRLHVRPVDLRAIAGDAVDAVRSAADAKDITIDVRLDPEEVRVHGDRLRLHQVVWNLLSNAVKFTPRGGSVGVSLAREGDSARLTVTDTGIGISPDLVPFVFDRFRQGDSTSTRPHGGLGLGLSIVRHLVEQHGGVVSVSSNGEGRGSRFEVSLPVGAAYGRTERRAARVPPLAVPSLQGLRVVVAEDKPDARIQLQDALERYGASVVSVSTIADAVHEVDDSHPDVLLTDVHMANQSVAPLIDKLKQEQEAGRHIPAVAVSEYVRSEDRVQALLSGFNGYIPTPVNPEELAAIVSSLARARLPRATPPAVPPRSGERRAGPRAH